MHARVPALRLDYPFLDSLRRLILGNSECERAKEDRGTVVLALLCSNLVALQERYCPCNFLLALSTTPSSLWAVWVDLCATSSPAVICGGFGSNEASRCATNCLALQFDCSSAAWCSKMLIESITPSPASTQ